MTKRLAAAVAATLIGLSACSPIIFDNHGQGGSSTVRCEEDMPCWNPLTMGNHRGSIKP